ncbi:TraR/DksA C4-type zinc finger protein [Halomonas rhizosphaerae]|uniref:TraR/DksA C4-type zinc finger protein n=1 Tax=Halomonas rhizosphaerae TaxID=3043296 RepID=A0ABT6V029_9GAMM|nr:TraR/DksA C4-type zinc finger protein [Halomonas rhizosphaerae]MDI5891587.1 TraR/DksA C4-type zinc finger protein [Halomonas rhizosphaerae]
MADNADIATELMERRLEGALASRLQATAPVHATECEECGDEIPAARRDAAPWATTCIECQGMREQHARHRR